ncbi:MAG: hypothetical protein GXC78_16145 [Chitinophagaceae bacterium]|nr:hypothetical protein [Chitinophagaceae bacterium]
MQKADGEDLKVQAFNAALHVIHEYSHYGDKETNNGVNSGQNVRKDGDLEVGKQGEIIADDGNSGYGISPSGHRGADVEDFIISGVFGVNRQGIAQGVGGGNLSESEKSKI